MIIFLITWAISGAVSAFIFWMINNGKAGKLAFTCLLLMFIGYLALIFTIAAVIAYYKIEQAEQWWKSIGVQKQAELTGQKTFDVIRQGGIDITDEQIMALYKKHKATKKS